MPSILSLRTPKSLFEFSCFFAFLLPCPASYFCSISCFSLGCAYYLLCIPNRSGPEHAAFESSGLSRFYCDLNDCSLLDLRGVSISPESLEIGKHLSELWDYGCQERGLWLRTIPSVCLSLFAITLIHSTSRPKASSWEKEAMIKGAIGLAHPRGMNKKTLA